MRFLFIVLFAFHITYASINSKITNTKNQLSYNNNKNIQITQTLNELTKKIISEKNDIEKIKKQIDIVQKEIKIKTRQSYISKSKLKKKQEKYKELLKTKKSFNKKLIEIISQLIQLDMMQNQMFKTNTSIKNIINYYTYKSYSKILKYNFNEIERKFFAVKIQIAKIEKELKKINREQKELQTKVKTLKKLKSLKQKKEQEIKKEKKRYMAKLSQIQKQNSILLKELERLNILKRKAERKRRTMVLKDKNPNLKVKYRVSSKERYFDRVPVIHYYGPKTIAPFKRYEIVRNFGKFIKPNYVTKVPVYNPNIVLKPIGSKNVRNILDGKVLSIVKNPAIGNLVVIGYKNGIHIIYANLSSISSIVKQGRAIKKGFIIGKVKDTLILEVTKNNANINPTELIK